LLRGDKGKALRPRFSGRGKRREKWITYIQDNYLVLGGGGIIAIEEKKKTGFMRKDEGMAMLPAKRIGSRLRSKWGNFHLQVGDRGRRKKSLRKIVREKPGGKKCLLIPGGIQNEGDGLAFVFGDRRKGGKKKKRLFRVT